jgi:hypothetical protein
MHVVAYLVANLKTEVVTVGMIEKEENDMIEVVVVEMQVVDTVGKEVAAVQQVTNRFEPMEIGRQPISKIYLRERRNK